MQPPGEDAEIYVPATRKPQGNVMLVPADQDDVPPIVTLINRAYRGSSASGSWTTEESYLSGDRTTEALLCADLLGNPQALLLKWVEQDDDVLGCVWLEPLDDRTWYMGSLATAPDRQNAGLGRTLLAAAEEQVRLHGGTQVRITVVNVRDTLIAWYQRRGYRLTSETEAFPTTTIVSASRCATTWNLSS